ncbi:N-acetyl-alpha-D-glucosaminyl L-malate synthase BshA [Formosa algae]|uniref:N-acetyl-alpha-D-glucosaminyl L-malate synthase BshA n=1 Tax=Formosa algae TaxID=225843 RepID=A0A9X0YPU9_9FLAO|nr:N-acetyl-alpha-D-glucosaminyl L-malate synthase BshA [Formosa algae]MBP1841167.1 N-acetyl-alpha-D-glucosaminyl L-malate synthase BshA [Formosa algae]MDQ0336413.1 N-acetyl-alpha-D-glucosaminyl L-malate synthase BshA [Formosa algae]OEI81377.1 N-acetyl-alpha-D-glucosaminyl L-malate synthase BshA [Formosa algae]
MRIGINCYPTFGGSGVVATELGLELAKRGHEIHFITYNQPVRLDLLSNKVHFHEVKVPEYPLFHYQPYELALSSKMVDMVKLHKIEILHVHYAIPHAYAAFMAKKMLEQEGIYIPVVTTLHGTDITLVGSHPFYKPAVSFSINMSDAVTSVSESLKEDTFRLFDIKKDINVITNFIDIEKYKHSFTDCQRGMMAPDDEKIITHISNLRPVKRILDVIKVFYNIQKEIPAKLMLIGDGPDKEDAENLCDELGITEKVVFFGRSNEIDKILCFSDLFLLPSETESFGLAALEAMASGVPVISSNTGGIPEVNVNGITGFLSDVGDVEDMSKNAIYILSDPARLKQFKQNAKERSYIFDIHNIVPQYEKLYEETLEKSLQLLP